MERFDILLTNWNRLDYLKRTIASLITSGVIHKCERFIIVDNASTEAGVKDFLEDMKRNYRAYIVSLPENKGWGSAVNSGLGLSRAPYLFLTNNDVEYKEGFMEQMFDVFNHSMSIPSGREVPKGIGILGVWRHTAHGFSEIQTPYFREMDNVPAVGWLIPKIAMEEIGMLPEHGPCDTKGGNGEDTAYVMRMKEKGFLVGIPTVAVEEDKLANHIEGY